MGKWEREKVVSASDQSGLAKINHPTNKRLTI
jgi:hypothetical protein